MALMEFSYGQTLVSRLLLTGKLYCRCTTTEYSKIISSLIFGYFLFNEMPNSIALVGVVLVILSAFLP